MPQGLDLKGAVRRAAEREDWLAVSLLAQVAARVGRCLQFPHVELESAFEPEPPTTFHKPCRGSKCGDTATLNDSATTGSAVSTLADSGVQGTVDSDMPGGALRLCADECDTQQPIDCVPAGAFTHIHTRSLYVSHTCKCIHDSM